MKGRFAVLPVGRSVCKYLRDSLNKIWLDLLDTRFDLQVIIPTFCDRQCPMRPGSISNNRHP